MRQGRDARRWRGHLGHPGALDTRPGSASIFCRQNRGTPTRRRREDTWDTTPPAVSYNGPSTNAQGGSARESPVGRARLSKSSGILFWDNIMSSGDAPAGPGAGSLLQQLVPGGIPAGSFFRACTSSICLSTRLSCLASARQPVTISAIFSWSKSWSTLSATPSRTRTKHARRSANSRPRRARCHGTHSW
jgi:hypothetical protein